MAAYAGLNGDEALNIGLAVREAAINAIVHGNGEDPNRPVEIVLSASPGFLEAKIGDRGSGFNVEAEPDPTDPENLMNTSGRGLLLMRAFVDKVEHRARRGGGTEVTLTKRTVARG